MFNISPIRRSIEVLRKFLFILALGSMLLAFGCDSSSTTDTTDTTSEVTDADFEATNWTDETHCKADDVYKAQYDLYLSEVISDALETSSIQATYDNYSALIAPYVTTELSGYSFLESDSDFYNAVDTLKSHATSRATAVSTYLNSQ